MHSFLYFCSFLMHAVFIKVIFLVVSLCSTLMLLKWLVLTLAVKSAVLFCRVSLVGRLVSVLSKLLGKLAVCHLLVFFFLLFFFTSLIFKQSLCLIIKLSLWEMKTFFCWLICIPIETFAAVLLYLSSDHWCLWKPNKSLCRCRGGTVYNLRCGTAASTGSRVGGGHSK